MTETNRSSGGIRRRTLLGWAPAGILAAGLSLANTPRANAAEYSTYELQMNLACFTHLTWVACDLTYEDADGIFGDQTTRAVWAYQKLRHMEEDGIAGHDTRDDLVFLTKLFQNRLGVTNDGYIGPNTIDAISKCQKGEGTRASGYADGPTLTALGLTF